jgi:hypothetical protein
MNISHENKVIWWALEETGEVEMSKILENYGFIVQDDNFNSKSGLKYDHYVTKSKQLLDYKVLCTIKNPYHRVFSLFLKLDVSNGGVKKKFLPLLREKFNYFVDNSLTANKLVIKPEIFLENEPPEMKYFEKWTFEDKIPDYFVRIEHFYEDLEKIDFINEITNINNTLNNDLYDYRNMYDYDNAKKVYHLYKKHFFLCNYDPFSFTHKELTKDEKIGFLHNIL